MKFNVEFNLNEEQVEELRMLQAAMKKAGPDSDDYYTLEKVFEFVMMLSSVNRVNKAIENAAYHYDKYYDDYPYKYGNERTKEMLALEKETGEFQELAYPNPRIERD